MQRNKKVTQLSKRLVLLSKDSAGVVTEANVTEVLEGLRKFEPRHYLLTLKTYLVLLRREIALQTALVASPAALTNDSLEAIAKHFTEHYQRPINAVAAEDSSLIAGVRVRVGYDSYDASVAGRLQRLAERVQ